MPKESLTSPREEVVDAGQVEKWAPVTVVRRLHQFSIVFGLFVFAPIVTFNFMPMLYSYDLPAAVDMTATFFILIAAAILPAYLVFKIFPTSDEARVVLDGVVFRRLGKLQFSDIKSYNTDDHLKLVCYGRPTLLLHPPTKGDIAQYPRFRAELLHALSRRTEVHGADAGIKRKHFYGSTAAKLLGLFLVVAGVGLILFMFLMSGSIMGGMPIALAGVAAGVALMRGDRLGR